MYQSVSGVDQLLGSTYVWAVCFISLFVHKHMKYSEIIAFTGYTLHIKVWANKWKMYQEAAG